MCYSVDEACTVWAQSAPRARVEHRCDLCFLPIRRGATYDRIAALYDGHWTTYRLHPECHALTEYIQRTVCGQDIYCIMEGDLHNEVREHAYDMSVIGRWGNIVRKRMREAA